jgi:hypothetical protein
LLSTVAAAAGPPTSRGAVAAPWTSGLRGVPEAESETGAAYAGGEDRPDLPEQDHRDER